MIEQIRRERGSSFKDVVNEMLRKGLTASGSKKKNRRFTTRTVDLGRPRLSNVDDVADVLEQIEDVTHR